MQGIDVKGLVAELAGVEARLAAGADSVDAVEEDVAYAAKLTAAFEEPHARVEAALAKARSAVNATKFPAC